MRDNPISISGAAMISSLGLNRMQSWNAVLDDEVGIRDNLTLESPIPEGRDGAQAPDIDDEGSKGRFRAETYLARTIQDAIRDAGLDPETDGRRWGLCVGTTLGGMRHCGASIRDELANPLEDSSASALIAQATAGLPFDGPCWTTSAACASGLTALNHGITMLQNDHADVMFVGGYDPISEFSYAGFDSLRLIARKPLQPFSSNREGMKIGEGYGLLVLERTGDIHERGGSILVHVAGWGESSDGHHLTQPHPEGRGAIAAIEAALESAGIQPDDIDMIAAHATATPNNDLAESIAYRGVFGDAISTKPIVGFKSRVGHTLGAAGAVELNLTATALSNGIIPTTANTPEESREVPELNIPTGAPSKADLKYTMTLSLGFGGANACVILRAADEGESPEVRSISPATSEREDVVITGVGVILPGIAGRDQLLQKIGHGEDQGSLAPGQVDVEMLSDLINLRKTRRIGMLSKLAIAATEDALRHAGYRSEGADPVDGFHCIVGCRNGASAYTEEYYRQIISDGLEAANPMLFAESVPNVASAHLSLAHGLLGSSHTIFGSRTSGMDALHVASSRIRSGDWDRCVVCAVDEHCEMADEALRRMLREQGSDVPGIGCGAISFILESDRVARERGAGMLASVTRTDSRHSSPDPRNLFETARAVVDRLGDDGTISGSGSIDWMMKLEESVLENARSSKRPEFYAVSPMLNISLQILDHGDVNSGGVIALDCFGNITGMKMRYA